MTWLDWLKDVPISAAIRERLALKDEQFNELKEKNEELVKRIGVLEAENADLKAKLKIQDENERFIDHHGVLWKKKLGGGLEALPFCPSCKLMMTAYFGQIQCSKCNYCTRIHLEDIAGIIEEVRAHTQGD